MFNEGECIEVRDPSGAGWIAAKFGYLAEDQPTRHIDHPGVNDGRGYEEPQYWVIYQEGDRDGTTGLHILSEIRRKGGESPVNRLSQFVNLGGDHGYRVAVDDGGQITLAAQEGPPGPASDLNMVILTLTLDQAQELITWMTTAISMARA